MDISGDEMGYNIGAMDIAGEVGRRKHHGAHHLQPRNPYGNPIQASPSKVKQLLYQVFGLGATTLGGAGAGTLNQTAQEAFRPERLILSDSVAGNTTINGIFLGVRPQIANFGGLPAAMFGAGAFETRVTFDTLHVGCAALINFTMAAAGTLSGGYFGTVAK